MTLPRTGGAHMRLFLALCIAGLLLSSSGLIFQPVGAARIDPTDNGFFFRLWARTDIPVFEGQANRPLVWGSESLSPLVAEETSNGSRLVQFFDKGGMQFNPDPTIAIGSPAHVLSAPLARELVTGDITIGEQQAPADISIAGDHDDDSGPTYATYAGLRAMPAAQDGLVLAESVDRNGNITLDDHFAQYGVTAAYHVALPGLDHQIASPFWNFIQSQDTIYEAARFKHEPLFEDHWAIIGLPLTEAYWSHVKLGGIYQDVLIQVFERRVLTYIPGKSEAWQVQFANTGRHYVNWRYGVNLPAAAPVELPAPPAPDYAALEQQLQDLVSGATGEVAVTILDLQTGQSVGVNGDQRLLAACTIKIPIMIAVAQDISAGKYTAADVEHLVLPAMGPSLTWPARELLRITGDGDIGAGVDRVNSILAGYGARNSLLTHPPGYWGEEYGYFASGGEVENWLTTNDLSQLLSGIWNGVGLTPSERNYVLWSLTLATPFLDSAFRAPLPEDVAAFHKIGVLYQPENTWNDAGLVIIERDGLEYAYVVAFLSNFNQGTYLNGYDLNQAVNALAWQTFKSE